MNIVPKAASTPAQAPAATSGQDARARAIARLEQSPVLNQNAIAPEEMAAIVPPSGQNTSVEEELQASEVTEEPVAEEPKAPTPQELEAKQRYEALARREKALRLQAQKQEQAIKAREDAIAQREAAIAAKDAEYKSNYISKDRFKADPLQALADAGASYEEITQAILNQTPKDPRVEAHISRLEAKLAALEAANEEAKVSQKTAQQQQYDAAVNQIKADAKKLVYTDPTFETIKATNSVDDVVALITETYNKDGRLLSVEEAAQEVEDYLVEEAMALTRIEKIKKRLSETGTASQQATQSKTPAQTPKQPQPMKTLTNATASSRQLTAKERAIAAFKGEKY